MGKGVSEPSSDPANENPMFERVAKAIFNERRRQLRAQIPRVDDDIQNYAAVLKAIQFEEDRVIGILFFSFFEDQLRKSLERILGKQARALLSAQGNGELSRTATQLRLVNGLGWINDKSLNNLKQLARIRNVFAHDTKAQSFHHPVVKKYLRNISPLERELRKGIRADWEDWSTDKAYTIPKRFDARRIYLCRSTLLIGQALVDLLAASATHRSSMDHRTILGPPSEWPEPCRLMHAVTIIGAARFMSDPVPTSPRKLGQALSMRAIRRLSEKMVVGFK